MAETTSGPAPKAPRLRYDCSRCPGYCCTYPRIEVLDEDIERLAAHFGITAEQAERRFTKRYGSDERVLRHQKDTIYGTICRFFDREQRRCTVYEARPAVCRSYPNGSTCGYYTFLQFERRHQGDPDFIPSA